MKLFNIFVFVILAIGLTRDYNRDKGQNSKAKIFHAIILAIICASYAGSFGILGSVIRNFDEIQQKYSVPIGIVPGQVHFLFYMAHLALSLVILILAIQMISRKEKALKLFLRLLPFLALLEIFSFYRGWIVDGDDMGVKHGIIILIGFLIIGGITTAIIWIYKTNFMKTFFEAPKKIEPMSEINEGNIEQN